MRKLPLGRGALYFSVVAAASMAQSAWAGFVFSPGDLVIAVEGDGSNVTNQPDSTYSDNQAAPLTLYQYSTTGTTSAAFAGALALPQSSLGDQYAISGEYGSSSEGFLSLSTNGQYLTLMGYGINAAQYNANPSIYSTACTPTPSCTAALAQSTSLSTASNYIPRVVALVSANGTVDTSTAVTNVFNGNNARSAVTTNGQTFYISGQGQSGDTTEGVFMVQKGSSTATAINTSYDTRSVQIIGNQLYVSQDSKVGTGQTAYIATLGSAGNLPTGSTTASVLPGLSTGSTNSPIPGTIALSNGNGNNVNASSGKIYMSPENYFLANSTTMYVADGGDPKAGGLGDGGLQKWTLSNGTWTLDYTLSAGLNLVSDKSASGTSGLFGLTGEVVGNQVELFATNSTLTDLGQTYLYGISDTLSATSASQVTGESFSVLATAPADTNFKGVAFAPVPLPTSLSLFLSGLSALGAMTLFASRRSSLPDGRAACAAAGRDWA
jgi:hypothetical protein